MVHAGQHGALVYQRRVDPRFDLAVDESGDRQQLDPITQLSRVQNVALGNLGDAFAPDLLRQHRRTERQRSEDSQLVGRVPGLDVVGRIGLGIPQLLRLAQRVGEAGATLRHPRQDVVGRAVDDADHAGDVVGRQVELKWPDERDAPAHAGLVRDADPARGSRREDGRTVFGHDLLVGRDDVFAPLDGSQDQRAGRLFPADHFDDDVHRRVVQDRPRIGHQRHVKVHAARLVRVAHQDLADLHRAADAALQRVALGHEHACHAGADGAQTQQPDAERSSHAQVGALARWPAAGGVLAGTAVMPGTEWAASSAMLDWRGATFQNCPR
jgi:hypothetical protein